MSSKRDLVEAHGYNRRRLITAFVSGAPGGREVEPVRYGRTLVGGLVLALLVVAGAAVSGFIKPGVPKNWAEEGLVIGKSSGSRFFAYKGELYPIINITSAKLLLKEGTKPEFVPDDLIAAKKPGVTIGISGAPEVLPKPSGLVQSGWTACTNLSGGILARIDPTPLATPVDDQAYRVSLDNAQYVIAGGRRYPVPDDAAGRLALRAVGLDAQTAKPVTGLWLNLIPQGSPLVAPTVDGAGRQVNTGVSGLDTVGTPVEVAGGRHYVLGRSGELLELSDFAWAIYSAGRDVTKVRSSDSAKLRTDAGNTPYPQDWPTAAVTPYTSPDMPCVQLETRAGEAPLVHLATPTSSVATTADANVGRRVATGSGALVRGTSAGVLNAGPVYLIDSSGTSFAVGKGGNGSEVGVLGYGSTTPRPVPKAWLDLFASGPELSSDAASKSPESGQ